MNQKRSVRRPAVAPSGTTCTLFLAGLAVATVACAGVRIPEERDDAFAAAVEAAGHARHAPAAALAWHYVSGASVDDPRYDRGLRLLAGSAEGLGLTHAAAVWWLEIAQARRDVELIPDAVAGLERVVMGGPHDTETLIGGYLASAELSDLPPEIQAFVDFQQGLDNARKGLGEWADDRFSRIPEWSPYHARARYVQAVRQVARRELEAARAALEALGEADGLPDDLAIEIHRSLARLHIEARRYPEALMHYDIVRTAAPDAPEVLLEMAWTHYHMGDSRRALGLLLALDAPAYGDLIAPERFLLEALALRRLCQFGRAREAAVRLWDRHGAALDDLYAGVPLERSDALRAAATHQGATRDLARLRDRLQYEREKVVALEKRLGEPLTQHLFALYDRSLFEVGRRIEASTAREAPPLADSLLAADEGVRLILHELGVALLRGRRRGDGPMEAPPPVIAQAAERAFFMFDGEYWSDELDDLHVFAEDRCID
jgi:tetratricopeptide (TPR) repeat protein